VHSPDALRRAVAAEDIKALTMVPGVAADHPRAQGPPRRPRRPRRQRDRARAPGRAVLARPGPVGSGQPRLVGPRRRGGRRRGRGRLR
jgi:hypothetical protein